MENRVDKAERLFKEGYNCSQAVFAAFCDIYGIEKDLALRISASFGGGIGRMREVCGAVSAMAMVAGLENGTVNGEDAKGKKENYDLVVKLAEEFKKDNGTIICRELLGLEKNRDKIDTTPQDRNEEYYRIRPCVDKVRQCAQIIQDIIISTKEI